MLYATLVTLLLRNLQSFSEVQRTVKSYHGDAGAFAALDCGRLLEVKGVSTTSTLASAYNSVEGKDAGVHPHISLFACVCFAPGSLNLSYSVSGEGRET